MDGLDGRQRLLRWYEANRRDLPWRRRQDAYAIWVSEVMLQQTRAEVVARRFPEFMERFPDLASLAAAELPDVLAAWSGLGYYGRARRLHAAARQVAAGGGGLPRDAKGLRELPGIGAYTAAAVASIAFGEPVAVLDGNVERVLARRLALTEDPRRASVRRRLLAAATELLDERRPGDSNQALMELGAVVCTPAAPECLACPLSRGCRAAASGDPGRYPVARRRQRVRRVARTVAVVEDGGSILLFRRSEASVRLAGLWELPWVDDCAGDAAARLAVRYGGAWELGEPLATVRHAITDRLLDVEVRRGRLVAGSVAEGPEARWLAVDELAGTATSSLVSKVLAAVPAE